ncbi:LPXTG cell wall anchor domain-containing protein [Streptococcus oriscaviae]|uniref:LPXTG cell wall anchor domain-containing protein n=1 Tax=Streptococcus oriscaviae TaxID=2781599 RepID=A0ABX7YIC4_9STRE|nr:LPXTG cell wall anchor domain-containing protein [Streptococcus oriscaviae]QUE53548.1 LPXTG cell wall anchor domain-containing protein [Streptococcus oriscaviae]
MKKHYVISALVLSGCLSSVVKADEAVPVPPAETVVTVAVDAPIEEVVTTENIVNESGSSAEVVPTPDEKPIEESGTTIETDKPIESTEEVPVDPNTPPAIETTVGEKPTEETVTAPVVKDEATIKAEENTGASSTGEAKPITTPVIDEPIVTNKGDVILSTQDGAVLVQTEAGPVLKEAVEIGAVKQSDGTVAVKTNTGELKVLPRTGEELNIILFFLGVFALAGAAVVFWRDNLVSFLKRIKK